MEVIIGSRFFKYEQSQGKNQLRVIKVVGWASQDIVSAIQVVGTSANKRFKIPVKKLKEDYTLLNPDAFIHFSIVKLDNNIEDVIVSMFQMKDTRGVRRVNDLNVPYCVCRQNIVNVHSTYIKAYENDYEIGMTLSQESCPEGFDFKIMTACNELKKNEVVAAYCDDRLDTILKCLKSKYIREINDVLYKLWEDHINSVPERYRLEASKIKNHRGYCKTLLELLTYHEFMYDFNRAFGIVKIPEINFSRMILSGDTYDGFLLNQEALEIIEKVYGFNLYEPICIKYDKDINFDLIKRKTLLIKDCNDKLYIVLYSTQEELMRR